MITVKIKNATIKSGDKWRKNQNYTMSLYNSDGVDDDTTIEMITVIIDVNYTNKVQLTKKSKVSFA